MAEGGFEQPECFWRFGPVLARHDEKRSGRFCRLRPKFMTVATMFVGLIPIMWATGTGSDVWKRIAAPMVGGIFTSFVLELVVYPAIYEIWKWHFEMKRARAEAQPAALVPSPEAEGL